MDLITILSQETIKITLKEKPIIHLPALIKSSHPS